jgi:hypothetical protein
MARSVKELAAEWQAAQRSGSRNAEQARQALISATRAESNRALRAANGTQPTRSHG